MKQYLHRAICGIMIGTVLFLPDFAFAAEDTYAQDKSWLFANLLDFLSWLWVVPAVVAGKLMTNEFVYGEFIGLTTLLWKIWQAMKTFAYITLWLVFLWLILKHFVMQEDVGKLGDTLKKTFIAGILIQMSWFLMAVLIDLSLVVTAAVSAIPLQIMDAQWNQLQYKFEVPHIVIDADTWMNITEQQTENTTSYITLDDVTPDVDSVSWPLVFLAASVMRLTDARFIGDDATDASGKNKNYEWIIIASWLKLLIVVMFVAPMVVLMIINAVRIFWIWIWILLSPFIVLDVVFNWPLQRSEQGDKFKLSTIFSLIFQPVVFVGVLSLGMIMIVWVLDALMWWEDFKRESLEDLQVYVQSDNVTRVWWWVNAEAYISWEMFKDLWWHVGWFVGEMILALFSIFLLWSLVKVWASFSAVTQEMANKWFEFAESSLKAVPIPWLWSLAVGHKALQEVKWLKNIQEAKQNEQAETALDGFYTKMWMGDENKRNGGISTAWIGELNVAAKWSWNETTRTKNFWDKMHGHVQQATKDNPVTYSSRTKETIDTWFNNWGKRFLRLNDEDTIEHEKAQWFIKEMMLNWTKNIDIPSSWTNTWAKLTNSTWWTKDWIMNV